MATETEKKKSEFGYDIPYEPTFFDKVKYFFARLFSTVTHFFKNLFGGSKSVEEMPQQTVVQRVYSKSNPNINNEDKKVEQELNEDKSTPTPQKSETVKDESVVKKEESDISSNITREIAETPALAERNESNTEPYEDGFIVDGSDDTVIVVGDDDIPVISVDSIGESDDIFAEIEDNDLGVNNDIHNSQVVDEVFSDTKDDSTTTLQEESMSVIKDEALDNEYVEIKSLKDTFFEKIRAIDSRAISMEANKNSLSVIFELEDESNILITLAQNGEIKDINRIETDFEYITDGMDFNAYKKKLIPITSSEIGFTGTAESLKKLMQENPDIINEIYNSKNEKERRENKMVADAMQVRVDNFEELKDILLGYLETANRNVITYDMQDKSVLVKLPTRDTGDVNIMEMERDLVINLVDMSYSVKVEKMDFASRSGGYKTEFENVDINELGAQFVAIHEAIKANSEFFAKDLSTDGPVEDTSYEEYIDDIFEEEENDKSRSSSRQRDKEKTMARNAAIKNKESYRSQRNDDDEEKKPQRKQHFRPNRDDDDDYGR